MNTFYCNFSDDNYKHHQQDLIKHINQNLIFDFTNAFTKEWLKTTDFYFENKKILDLERLCGYAIWKPYIILEMFKNINYGDIVVYMDCGDVPLTADLNKEIKNYMQKHDQCFIVTNNFNRSYTKRDCFVLMNCDEEKFWNAIQLEDGFLAFKKTDFNISFVEEWLEFCKDERIVTDLSNTQNKPNFHDFIDHRHDQSIISLLQIKYNIPTCNNNIRQHIKFNVLFHKNGEDFSNGTAKWQDGKKI